MSLRAADHVRSQEPAHNPVYLLHHVHELDDGEEDVKLIGAYSSQHQAEAAVARLRRQPGFAETPDGFHIEMYEIDKDHWTEGYISAEEALEGFDPDAR